MIKYDDVKNQTTDEYFKDFPFSKEIWEDNYKGSKDETIIQTFKRFAKAASSIEENNKKEIEEKLFGLFYEMKLIPGGRIMANIGINSREATTLFNCFIDSVYDRKLKNADSIKGIFKMLSAQAETLKSEGGYGINASWIRPKGTYIRGVGNRTPGVLKFMELWDKSSEVITMGSDQMADEKKDDEKIKIRKGAQMLVLSVWHPEIEDFIVAKQTANRLTKFNMSVGITEGFMDAVQKNKNWDLVFPDTTFENYNDEWNGDINEWQSKGYPVKVYKTIKASELWERITKATYNRNEPGVLFLDLCNLLNPIQYIEKILATNPCVSGDTLIAVADGRNAITIKQLADENKPVDVYSIKDGKVTIQKATQIFKTKENTKLIKIVLDDNSFFKCTPDHKIMLRNGNYTEAKDLKENDSLMPFNSYLSHGYVNYRQISSNNRRDQRQYRMIAEYNNLIVDPKTTAIHHKDFNCQNDHIENLISLTHEEHKELHRKKMLGKNNPYYKMSDEWKFNFASKPGEKNGRYKGITNDELKEKIRLFILEKGRQINRKEYQKFAKENNLPLSFSKFRKSELGNFTELIKNLTIECNLKYFTPHQFTFAKNYNHKVKSIEFCENEDVYDMIVPGTNNFGIITSNKDDNFIESSGIFVHNCGEIPNGLGVCNLTSINLVKFIKKVKNEFVFDYDEFVETIKYGVRFLDNVLDLSTTPIPEYTKANKEKRRIGLGLMGMGSIHLMLGIKYGSKKSLELIEKIFKTKSETELLASAELGKEKGSFPLFDKEKYFNTYWWKNLKISPDVKKIIEKIGCMRNSHHSMNAPTGNCIRKNSKIRTNEGIKTLKQIFKENNIDIKKEKKNQWFIPVKELYAETLKGNKRITGLYINEKKKLYSVKLKDKSKIEGTDEHKVLVKLNDKQAIWKELKDLKIGDKILKIK